MEIKNMFEYDINRPINGVVQVNQDDNESVKQELSEYVVTSELSKHFDTFFDNYSNGYHTPTNDIGVWISGFYGSGKSHFLKMLSYLLANKEVDGKKPYEYLQYKLGDALVEGNVAICTQNPTETILFEISKETVGKKNDASIIRAIAKVFYNHLGYYGDDLKIVKLEKFIAKTNKTDEFKKVFKEINGEDWEISRDGFAFFEDDITKALVKVLNISENSASNWFNGVETDDISIDSLTKDINEYVITKDDDFRLLFMIDEVGQYINTDVNLKLSLQGIVEKIGSTSRGKVWVVVTSQEAIDTFTNHTELDFSGILGRFYTKLSLTSSSADEVIKKRILKKTTTASQTLALNYQSEATTLKNIFKFSKDCTKDLKGYKDEFEYIDTYPFVPYQFKIIQKVFDAIRVKGIASKHQSSGERSLIECYQMAAQKVGSNDENTLVPFYYFYDTVSNALDTTIRRVIDRCQKASDNGDGIEEFDVKTLKLLYLIRYIDDIPSNIENISILMVDDVRVDSIDLRKQVKESLDRLINSNYVSKSSDRYNFLTDEEQDIARDIKEIDVNATETRKKIAETIFGEIYSKPKFKYNIHDFDFDKYVDDTIFGNSSGEVVVKIITNSHDLSRENETNLKNLSIKNSNEVIIVLDKIGDYYEEIEQVLKISKFAKQKNTNDMSTTAQEIIRRHQSEAKIISNKAKEYISNAIAQSTIYIYGEKFEHKSSNAEETIESSLKALVESVYSNLNYVNSHIESDAEIIEILNEPIVTMTTFACSGVNNEFALNDLSQWLELQEKTKMSVTMGDVQRKYQKSPYGFREIDIAGLIAKLIVHQKIEIKYGGVEVNKDDKKIVDYLRKKNEIEKVKVVRRVAVDESIIRYVVPVLSDYLDQMDVPSEEVELVNFAIFELEQKLTEYNDLLHKYTATYPQKDVVISCRDLISGILSQKSNNVAFLNKIIDNENDLINAKTDFEPIKIFFNSQKDTFDNARQMEVSYKKELNYFLEDTNFNTNLETVNEILMLDKPYRRIKELPELLENLEKIYLSLLVAKKDEVKLIAENCQKDIHLIVAKEIKLRDEIKKADEHIANRKAEILEATSLTILDAMITQISNYRDTQSRYLQTQLTAINSPKSSATPITTVSKPVTNRITIRRQDLCPLSILETKEDVDNYVELLRQKLTDTLDKYDSVEIN